VDLAGKLLVALPALSDGIFDRSVVLLLTADDRPVGVILNQPTTTALGEVLPGWSTWAADPGVVFVGGPCEPEVAIAVARGGPHGFETVDLGEEPDGRPVRVFAGYAGWAPGQLQDELRRGAWAVCDAEPGDATTEAAATLWRDVLARQPGPIARLARLPDDLSVN
jgi:putative transcriptional regulator